MTQSTVQPNAPAPTTPTPKIHWWKRPWIAPLWVICGLFFIWRVPSYLGFTPEDSLVALRSNTHYLLLSGHIVLGTVTLASCCLQVWPWLRQRHPKVHRVSGRIYVIAVIPASVLAFVSSVLAVNTPPSGRFGNALLAVLWLVTAIAGYRYARKRRFVEHRRWMLRSFALCFSIVMNRLWLIIFIIAFDPLTNTVYGGNEAQLAADVAVASIWSSWVFNLLFVEWWLDRKKRPKRTVA